MCIDLQMLSAYMDGELKEPYRTQVKEHLEHCAACRNLLENMKKLDEKIQKDTFSEEELNRNKDAIFKKLDAKCFGNGKQISFFRRKICFSKRFLKKLFSISNDSSRSNGRQYRYITI